MSTTAGPLTQATLIVHDAAPMVAAYAALGLTVATQGQVAAAHAQAWGQPQLSGCAVVKLACPDAAPLLRLIVQAGTPPRPTRFGHGWLALEILVRDVDALAAPALAGGFQIVGPPADLELSQALRAMQVVGPAGEMLYLTQVKAPVPPFELPLSAELPPAQTLGPLFIAVMSVADRAAARAACAPLRAIGTLQFETKVTVLNRALGRPIEARWPLATVALAGRSLFEIDEVYDPQVQGAAVGTLPAGLAWITLRADVPPSLFEIAPGVWLERVPSP